MAALPELCVEGRKRRASWQGDRDTGGLSDASARYRDGNTRTNSSDPGARVWWDALVRSCRLRSPTARRYHYRDKLSWIYRWNRRGDNLVAQGADAAEALNAPRYTSSASARNRITTSASGGTSPAPSQGVPSCGTPRSGGRGRRGGNRLGAGRTEPDTHWIRRRLNELADDTRVPTERWMMWSDSETHGMPRY